MKPSFALTVLLLCCVIPAFSGAVAEDFFQAANRAYAAGKYEEAVKLYQEAQSADGSSPGLLYNLGNAFARLNQRGMAVLNYKRSLYLRPWDGDAVTNLELTLKDAGIYPEPQSKIVALLRAFSLNRWSLIALITLGLLAFYIAFKGVFPYVQMHTGLLKTLPKPLSHSFVTLCVSVLFISLAGVLSQLYQLKEAVVLSDNASLQVSPFDAAEHRSTLKPGRIVTVKREFEGYYLVEDANGQTGWIKKDAAEMVVK